MAAPLPGVGGTAADIARAIRENSFDRDECYRVRDLTIIKEDIRIYLTDGYLIFSKPVAGRRMAAVFSTDVEGGDGEVILLPPDRAERRSLAAFIDSPNLDEHIRAALLLFTGDVYEQLMSQMANNPANRKAPEMAPVLDEQWSPVLRNLGTSYQVRLTLDLMAEPARADGLFAGMFRSTKLGNFDLVYDPDNIEQILAGQLTTRQDRLYFDTWTSFPARSARKNPTPPVRDPQVGDYRIDATVAPDLTLNVMTRVKVKVNAASLPAVPFEIAREMSVTEVRVDGVAAEVLQAESTRLNLVRGGNNLFLVAPAEPLHAGREYEFEFHHSGKVIHEAGDHVFYVSSRGNWYPASGHRFSNYDLTFHFPRSLDLVSAGETVDDRIEGEMRVVRRRTSAPVRIAAFNLGDYEHAKVERGGYVVDVCANRKLEPSLQPRAPDAAAHDRFRRAASRAAAPTRGAAPPIEPRIPNPIEHLQALAGEVASAMEFMASRFGPPALPHLTVSPIPGAFGQGFPGLIYLSTLAYLTIAGHPHRGASASSEMFFQDVLQAHETAHQWWGNRVTPATYRDNWLMEALANYSALLYLEKRRGTHSVEIMLDNYRDTAAGQERSGPGGGFGRPHRVGHAAGDLAGTARVALHHLRQGKLDHADAARPHGRPALPGAAGRDQQALRPEGHHHRGVPPARRRVSAAEIRRPETGELLRTVGLRHGHSDDQADVEGEGRGAEREADRHGDAIRRGRGFHRRGAGGDYDRQGADDDAVGAVGRGPGDVHGPAEGGSAEGGAGSALRAAAEVRAAALDSS